MKQCFGCMKLYEPPIDDKGWCKACLYLVVLNNLKTLNLDKDTPYYDI